MFLIRIVVLLVFTTLSFGFSLAFYSGLGVSAASLCIYYLIQVRHTGRISDYPQQALVVVVTATMTKFFIAGALLVWLMTKTDLSPATVLLGFAVGQIFFLMNQLTTVTKNNGK